MSRGPLFSRYKKRTEELRVEALSPVERQAEQVQIMSDEITVLRAELDALAQELHEMDRRYHLSWNAWGQPAPQFGAPGTPEVVARWWTEYAKKVQKAQNEFNQALLKWSSMKGS